MQLPHRFRVRLEHIVHFANKSTLIELRICCIVLPTLIQGFKRCLIDRFEPCFELFRTGQVRVKVVRGIGVHCKLPTLEVNNAAAFKGNYWIRLSDVIKRVGYSLPDTTIYRVSGIISDCYHTFGLDLSTPNLYVNTGACRYKNPDKVDDTHLADAGDISQCCKVVSFFFDRGVVRYFCYFSVFIEDKTEVVLHCSEPLVC